MNIKHIFELINRLKFFILIVFCSYYAIRCLHGRLSVRRMQNKLKPKMKLIIESHEWSV